MAMLSELIAIDNGVKQGTSLHRHCSQLYFAATLSYAFGTVMLVSSYVSEHLARSSISARLNAKSRTFQTLVRELLYADDADFVAHTEEDMQRIMDLFSDACDAFGLTISLEKTKVMLTPPPGHQYIEPNIYVKGTRLKAVVDSFVYLGSTLSRDGSLDSEISLRIARASKAFGELEKRVWSDRAISIRTKISVYESCVLTILLYSSETWTTYRRHLKTLERFHQTCLRRILNIQWRSLTPDAFVLQQANVSSIEERVLRSQMRWAGHLARMEDSRLPKQLFYGELQLGKRPRHKPRKRYKDVVKNNLKILGINVEDWEKSATNRPTWRRLVYEGCRSFEAKRLEHSILKRALRKQHTSGALETLRTLQPNHLCDVCGRVCLSRAGLLSHMRSHEAGATK